MWVELNEDDLRRFFAHRIRKLLTFLWAGPAIRAPKGVEEGKQHVFLLPGTGMGCTIPKRVFDTPEAAERFLGAARSYWQASRDKA